MRAEISLCPLFALAVVCADVENGPSSLFPRSVGSSRTARAITLAQKTTTEIGDVQARISRV